MKIITEGFPNDDEVLVDRIQVTYLQNPDCVSNRDNDYQELTLETRDGGGGKFINIRTNEYGWSISEENDLIPILKHFRNLYEDTNNC